MLEEGFSARSIVNRCYYSMFYMALALFLKKGVPIPTSKHTGVMGIFDREFIITGKLDKKCSKLLHKAFDQRIEYDYKELPAPELEDAKSAVENARYFIAALKKLLSF